MDVVMSWVNNNLPDRSTWKSNTKPTTNSLSQPKGPVYFCYCRDSLVRRLQVKREII